MTQSPPGLLAESSGVDLVSQITWGLRSGQIPTRVRGRAQEFGGSFLEVICRSAQKAELRARVSVRLRVGVQGSLNLGRGSGGISDIFISGYLPHYKWTISFSVTGQVFWCRSAVPNHLGFDARLWSWVMSEPNLGLGLGSGPGAWSSYLLGV